MNKNKLLFIFLCLFSPRYLQAQTDTINVGVSPVNIPGSLKYVSCLEAGPDGNIWIGTGLFTPGGASAPGAGALRFNMLNWKQYSPVDSTLPWTVYAIHRDFGGKMWFGTIGGLAGFQNNKWVYYHKYNSQLKCDTVLSVSSRFNTLYLGSANGLFRFNGGSFIRYDSNDWKLQTNLVTAVCVDKSGAVWAGTPKGIACLKNGSWTSYHNGNSKYSATYIRDIKEDGYKRIWLSTNKGYFIIENGVLSSAAERYPCYATDFTEYNGTQMTVDDKGAIFINGKGLDSYGRLVMMEINGETIRKYYYSSGSGWNNLLYANGYIWKTGGGSYFLERFNHRAYKELLPVAFPGYELADTSYAYLDINKVRAVTQNRGDMFYTLFDKATYEDKDFPCRNMLYRSALWMSGKDSQNNVYAAAMTYRQRGSDYTNGPLDTVNANLASWRDFNRTWKIDRSTVESFKQNFATGAVQSGAFKIPGDFLTWPANSMGNFSRKLAPYYDYNNDGYYNPYDGDYPVIKGDQMLYWIFNDNIIHSESGGNRFLAEIHASAYAYNCDTIDPNSDRAALNRTTFYEYRIINRSKRAYKGVTLGVWADFDIGNWTDDYVGCNPRLNTAFGYNGDSLDEGFNGFGYTPPIANITMLSDSMNSFMYFTNGAPYPMQDPNNASEVYNFMNARWQNGNPMHFGGSGNNGTIESRFAFPDNDDPSFPGQTWSEKTAGNKPGDRRALLSSASFDWDPGETRIFTYAIMHTPDAFLPEDEQKNENRIKAIRHYYATNNFPSCSNPETSGIDKSKAANANVKVYPNPGHGIVNFEIDLNSASTVEISIQNMLGQEVLNLEDRANIAGKRKLQGDVSMLPTGLYIYVIKSGNTVSSGKLLITK